MGIEFLGGLAAAAIGTGLSIAATQEDASAMNRTAQNALNEQAALQNKSTRVAQTSAQQSTLPAAQKSMATGQQNAQAQYAQLQGASPASTGLTALDPVRQQQTSDIINQSNAASARLQGYNQWSLDQALKDLQAKEQLGALSQQSGNLQAALPLELQQASHAGDALGLAGTGLSTLGSLAGLYSVYNTGRIPGATAATVPVSGFNFYSPQAQMPSTYGDIQTP